MMPLSFQSGVWPALECMHHHQDVIFGIPSPDTWHRPPRDSVIQDIPTLITAARYIDNTTHIMSTYNYIQQRKSNMFFFRFSLAIEQKCECSIIVGVYDIAASSGVSSSCAQLMRKLSSTLTRWELQHWMSLHFSLYLAACVYIHLIFISFTLNMRGMDLPVGLQTKVTILLALSHLRHY